MGAQVNAKDFPRGPDVLGKVERRDSVAAGNIEDSDAWSEIEMMQQGLGKRGGPIVLSG
jgi:hypothetical protein